MKIFKYLFSEDMNPDAEYLIEKEFIQEFTQTKLELQVHAFSDKEYFFIADDLDQNKMIDIINNTKDLQKAFNCKIIDSIIDVTEDILTNIHLYDNLENNCSPVDKNVLLNYYYSLNDVNYILDKILDKGISSITKHDKIILDLSVK